MLIRVLPEEPFSSETYKKYVNSKIPRCNPIATDWGTGTLVERPRLIEPPQRFHHFRFRLRRQNELLVQSPVYNS